jgi:hypothetical protein
MSKTIGVPLLVVCAAIGAYLGVRAIMGPGEAAASSRERMFVDVTTGKPFQQELEVGMTFPVQAPSGGKSGYPAEPCYWNADGSVRQDPSWVVLNETQGKHGPTFCPDCGRLVVIHNPPADAGRKPPPTKAEWDSRHAGKP